VQQATVSRSTTLDELVAERIERCGTIATLACLAARSSPCELRAQRRDLTRRDRAHERDELLEQGIPVAVRFSLAERVTQQRD